MQRVAANHLPWQEDWLLLLVYRRLCRCRQHLGTLFHFYMIPCTRSIRNVDPISVLSGHVWPVSLHLIATCACFTACANAETTQSNSDQNRGLRLAGVSWPR